jgi:oxygen-independent coproporphyrinogen-3 oxidase
MGLGLYIHIPFCRSRCSFCAFYLEIQREDRVAAYIESLLREIRLHARRATLEGRPVDTVYFGGGTPTALEPRQLCRVLDEAAMSFGLADGCEVSLEAHPDTVDRVGLVQLKNAGFNRISFGVQSMNEQELLRVGRRSSARRTQRAVGLARDAGFENISLDLMYGLPGQSLTSWRSTIEEALALDPTHLSCYALTIEEGTALAAAITRSGAEEPDVLLQNEMEDEADARLPAYGFDRYEISNYCRQGFTCRHNLLYWEAGDYLGLGPSAQSYVRGRRFGNVADLASYGRSLLSERLPLDTVEELTPTQQRREALVFGLRLSSGVRREMFCDDQRPSQSDEQTLSDLLQTGLVEVGPERIRLTPAGRRLADTVAVRLL